MLVSILGAAGLWLLGTSLMGEDGVPEGAYGVLICEEAVPDAEIGKRLETEGITGFISESGQSVLLDSFGGIEYVSLDTYPLRVLPFDPRNDGYAEKLRSLFIRDGKRLVYIPIDSPPAAQLEQQITAALGDIPHSFVYPRGANTVGGRYSALVFALFCGAVGAFFLIRPVRSALRPHVAVLIPCLPPLIPLALGGTRGFALIGLLAGMAALIAGPLFEKLVTSRLGRSNRILNNNQRDGFKAYLILLSLLFFCFGVFAFFSGMPPVLILLVFLQFCGVLAFSLWGAFHGMTLGALFSKQRQTGHQRFAPVLIISRPSLNFSFSWAILPFVLAACVMAPVELLVRFPASAPASFPAGFELPPASAVTEADYDAHCRFQLTFSFRSLHVPAAADAVSGIKAYKFAEEGLPVYDGAATISGEYPQSGIPPFPLGALVSYLETAGQAGQIRAVERRAFSLWDLILVLLPLLFMLPGIVSAKKPVKLPGTRGKAFKNWGF